MLATLVAKVQYQFFTTTIWPVSVCQTFVAARYYIRQLFSFLVIVQNQNINPSESPLQRNRKGPNLWTNNLYIPRSICSPHDTLKIQIASLRRNTALRSLELSCYLVKTWPFLCPFMMSISCLEFGA